MTTENKNNSKWQVATLVESHMVASNVMSLTFSLPEPKENMAGQHYDIRLTAPDGYMAERSYSLASPPEQKGTVEFGVQLLENGEVSPYLFALKPGGKIEVRGPIGGHIVWGVQMPGPLILIGGGSGMVPLMCMLRHHLNHVDKKTAIEKESGREVIFLISARELDFVLYKEELEKIEKENKNIKIVITLTDKQPERWTGYSRRVDKEMLTEVLGNLKEKMPMTYICGPTKFVEVVASTMITVGFNAHSIKTERFG